MRQSDPQQQQQQGDGLSAIRRAAEGLAYPSESDAPFEVFRWRREPGSSASASASGSGSAEGAVAGRVAEDVPIEEVDVASFFRQLERTSDAPRFGQLRAALERTLGDLRVFRAGEANVTIYVIGRCTNGDWAGVRTTAVET